MSQSAPATALPVRVAILCDTRLFCEGVRGMLAIDPRIAVVGEADASSIAAVVRTAAPDVLLADAHTDAVLSVCADLRRDGQRPWVILLGAEGETEWAVRALESGARGILGRTASPGDLVRAVHAVHDGQVWARKEVMARIVETLATLSGVARAEEILLSQRLSCREREIARHAAEGLSNQEIASLLDISPATVKAHLTHVFQKLGVRDRGQLSARWHRGVRPASSA